MNKKDQIRDQAESDLESFIHLVHPNTVLGSIHKELIRWWTREDSKQHQLVLLPRDHQKSRMIAYRVVWEITRRPWIRVLYISSTANLATKQLKFIKDILTSPIYSFYWPEMVNKEFTQREKWTESEISVDHPLRKKEAVRDPTIFTAGLTTNITGLHCDIAVMDDVVVGDNAYSEDTRDRVKTQASYLASIAGTGSKMWVIGTRYHPQDLYKDLLDMIWEEYNDDGEIMNSHYLYEVFERQVEDRGDMTGQYLWPKQQRADGRWFGFDSTELAKKKAQYLDKTQFRAQYYNNPQDIDSASITPEMFQYYEPQYLKKIDGRWYFKNTRLNVFAAVDFAWGLTKRSDYTCIAVVGVDLNYNYYILELDRFKTNLIGDYFNKILRLHQKWDFRKIRCEVTAAQEVIVKDLKENYIRPHGLALSIEDDRPKGDKEERIEATLQPRYQNRQVWHYPGGTCQTLEEELVQQHPPHDDVKDALAACVATCVPPSSVASVGHGARKARMQQFVNARFGGIG